MKFYLAMLVITVALIQGSCGGSTPPPNSSSAPFGATGQAPAGQAPGNTTQPSGGTEVTNCAVATAELEKDYAAVNHCTHDADCNYVNGFFPNGKFEIIPRADTVKPVAVKDCLTGPGEILFLTVANGMLVSEQSEHIAADAQAVQKICAAELGDRVRCEGFSEEVFVTPPSCSPQGICVIGEKRGESRH